MTTYLVDIGVPTKAFAPGTTRADVMDTLAVCSRIETELDKLGATHTGGGMGFGFRDLQYEVTSTALAEEATSAVIKVLRAAGYTEILTNENQHPNPNNSLPYVSWGPNEPFEPCGVSITMGPAHDPYGSSCIKSKEFHFDLDNEFMHVGYDPFGPEEDGSDAYARWGGGGSAAGDALPTKNYERNIYFDEAAYQEYVDYRMAEKEAEDKR